LEETEEVSIEADVTEHPRDDKSRPYLCTVCDKRFTQRGNLSRHKRIHTGEKPFVCTVCDKRFTRRGHLSRHKLIHTGEMENTVGSMVTMNMHEPAVRSLETGAATSVVLQYQVVAHSERIQPDPPLQGGHIVRPRASASSTVLPQTLASSTPTSGVTDKPFACTVCDKRFSARHGLVMVVLCNRADHYIFAL